MHEAYKLEVIVHRPKKLTVASIVGLINAAQNFELKYTWGLIREVANIPVPEPSLLSSHIVEYYLSLFATGSHNIVWPVMFH